MKANTVTLPAASAKGGSSPAAEVDGKAVGPAFGKNQALQPGPIALISLHRHLQVFCGRDRRRTGRTMRPWKSRRRAETFQARVASAELRKALVLKAICLRAERSRAAQSSPASKAPICRVSRLRFDPFRARGSPAASMEPSKKIFSTGLPQPCPWPARSRLSPVLLKMRPPQDHRPSRGKPAERPVRG